MTDCHVGDPGRQTLWVIEPGQAARAVAVLPATPPVPPDWCEGLGFFRFGKASRIVAFLQRLGVSHNGTIVFEVADDFSPDELGWRGILTPDQEGIFAVRADGSGMRRLGPASRMASFKFRIDPSTGGILGDLGGGAGFGFSPDGQMVAFTDMGTAPSGAESVQVFTLSLADGVRRQVTRLPPIVTPSDLLEIIGVTFVDAKTIYFAIQSLDGIVSNIVGVDDGEIIVQRPPTAIPGASLAASFAITGDDRIVIPLLLPEDVRPEDTLPGFNRVVELFIQTDQEVLQLTDFARVDTNPGFLTTAGGRVVFSASTNRLGTNPHNNCQFFSVDALGGDLRQLTFFDPGEPSAIGCIDVPPPGCFVFLTAYDAPADVALFESSCDPFGGSAAGEQLFAMRSDGTGLRQLTNTSGAVPQADSVSVQLPGPFAHPAAIPGG